MHIKTVFGYVSRHTRLKLPLECGNLVESGDGSCCNN